MYCIRSHLPVPGKGLLLFMENILASKISKLKLTKTQQRIADYFLENMERLGSLTSIEIAEEIGVSDASVIRFSRMIGYKGFADLKDHIYEMLMENAISGLTLAERKSQSDEMYKGKDIFSEMESIFMRNVTNTFRKNTQEDLNEVVSYILNSCRRYVIGLRGCKGIATNFGRLLGFMLPKVTWIIDGECTSISELQDIGPEDLLIMIVYTRFYKIDEEYLKIAKSRGARICLITNDPGGALAPYANKILAASTINMSFFNSKIGAEVLIESLITLVGKNLNFQDRLVERDAILKNQLL